MSFWIQNGADLVECKGLYADCILHHKLRRSATTFSITFDRNAKFERYIVKISSSKFSFFSRSVMSACFKFDGKDLSSKYLLTIQ